MSTNSATPVLIGGTIAIDSVKTPDSSAERVLGGSAAYAAVACQFYSPETRLLGVVGADFPEPFLELLASKNIDLSGIEYSAKDSFAWSGEYMEGMAERETLEVAINVLEDWQVKVPGALASSPLVVLANMSPENQLQMLGQLTGKPRYVIADTMDLWIEIARETLGEVLKKIDCLVLNEGEAVQLAKERNLILAGEKLRQLGPRHVIIKVGEFGSYLFGPEGSFYRIAAYPLTNFVDPTGAGDSFLGALAGYLSSLSKEQYEETELRDAMVRGSIAASFTCEDFSTHQLQNVTRAELDQRLEQLREMSCW